MAIDLADTRLDSALRFGADTTINNGREDAIAQIMEMTDGLGADVAFEAVGLPATFELATERARSEGVKSFTALMLADNDLMLNLISELGVVHDVHREQGTVELTVDLTDQTGARAVA